MIIGLFQKKPKQRNLRTCLFEKNILEVFKFAILAQTVLYPWKILEIVLHPMEISRPKMKTYGNSIYFFNIPFPIYIHLYKLIKEKKLNTS